MTLALLGGLLGLDTVSCAQTMVSRPIVAGPLAGLVLGDPLGGMWAGILLEVVSLRQLPIGSARHWDGAPAAVTSAATMAGTSGPAGLLLAVGLGVLVGWAGMWSMHGLRQLNGLLVGGAGRGALRPATLSLRHLSALGLDFLRAALLTLAGVWLVTLAPPLPALGGRESLFAIMLVGLAGAAFGADLRMLAGGRRVWMAFGAGAVLTTVVSLWLS